MKILVISGTFHPEVGGPPVYLYGLLESLVERGHQVAVITYGDAALPHAYPYPVTRISRRQAIPLRLLRFAWEILREGRGYDLLFVSDYGFPAALANLILRKPMVMKIVGDFAWEFSIRHRLIDSRTDIDMFQHKAHPWRASLLKRIQASYTQRADRIIVPSRYLKDLVRGWGVPESRIEVIYNAPDSSQYKSLPSKEEARRRLGLNGKVLLTVGRLTPWKGIDQLIEAVARLRAVHPEISLVVVGDGPASPDLQRLAHDRSLDGVVSFRGQVPHEQVAIYLRAADAFVLYSGYEGLPHVALEAMLAEVPVILSALGGNVEVVENGVDGLLVPVDGDQALDGAITRVLGDQALAEQLARRARDKVERVFNWGRMVERTLMAFERVVAEKHPGI